MTRSRLVTLALFSLAIVTSGCASLSDKIGPRASFDLDCPVSQITFHEDVENQYSARGCGGEAAYYSACEATSNGQGYCTWRAGYVRRPASAGGEAMPAAPFSTPPAQ